MPAAMISSPHIDGPGRPLIAETVIARDVSVKSAGATG